MNIFTERLIKEVKKRPVLYDKNHDLYSNRSSKDQEWTNLAAIMKKDKEFLRNKWRNLRDQFQKELRRVTIPLSSSKETVLKHYKGKWGYFPALLYLKDFISLKYQLSERAETSEETSLEKYNIENNAEILERTLAPEDSLSPGLVNEYANVEHHEEEGVEIKIEIKTPEYQSNDEIDCKRRRFSSENLIDDDNRLSMLCSSIRKEELLPVKEDEKVTEIDDDLLFVKSLVPYLKKLSPIRKLMVRNEIQNILIREMLCDKCKCGQEKGCCNI